MISSSNILVNLSWILFIVYMVRDSDLQSMKNKVNWYSYYSFLEDYIWEKEYGF
jgi:hypothetical protein